MEISRDQVRRQRRAIDRANDQAMRATAQVMAAAFEDERSTDDDRARVALGGLARRRFLTIGGFSVAAAALLAACGAEDSVGGVPKEGEAPSTTALAARAYTDAILLRTAASLERSAMAAYDAALGVLTGPARDVAAQFKVHHQAHAAAMDDQVRKLGGQPYTTSNPAFDEKVLNPALALVKSDQDALQLAHAIENVAAHTYQAFVPLLAVPALRSAAMTIGSVEARHAALLAGVLGAATAPSVAALPAAGATSTVAAATTTTVAGAVAVPGIYVVPGSFEPLAASTALVGGQLLTIAPLGPNSYAY